MRETIEAAERRCRPMFESIEETALANTARVLDAMQRHGVASRHFAPTTGYGYDDVGRDTLEKLFADLFHAQAAIVRPQIASGTHALSLCLFGLLRPGDELLYASGAPYDTLEDVIGVRGCPMGSLREMNVSYAEVPLGKDGRLDLAAIRASMKPNTRVVAVQRSRGYSSRPSLMPEDIAPLSEMLRRDFPSACLMVDNCYGEFTQTAEPVSVGADLMVGSLIKNGGGGIAPTGGYIAGRADLVERCGHRLTAPGTGRELGCTLDTLRQLYLGLYYAPGVTAEAVKTSIYSSCLLELLGKEPTPRYTAPRNDIITSFEAGSPEALVAFCQGIQQGSPVDSFVRPEPYAMAGYADEVIMAAGAFTEGSSIELSCDGPMRAPYTVYLQGGLNFAASRAGVLLAVQKAFEKEL